MIFHDTQIVAFSFNGHQSQDVSNVNISSIVANEFLLVYSDKPMEANYYLPNMYKSCVRQGAYEGVPPLSFTSINGTVFRKKNADRIVLDFGNDFGQYIEFGSYSIAELINNKLNKIFMDCISDLPKDRQKLLKKKFEFLLENEIMCHPINSQTIKIAYELLHNFIGQYSMKSNVRNTVNDMLILSSSIEKQAKLISQDNLLNEFASKQVGGKIRKWDEFVECDFTHQTLKKADKNNKESKGYINRGWNYKIQK